MVTTVRILPLIIRVGSSIFVTFLVVDFHYKNFLDKMNVDHMVTIVYGHLLGL